MFLPSSTEYPLLYNDPDFVRFAKINGRIYRYLAYTMLLCLLIGALTTSIID